MGAIFNRWRLGVVANSHYERAGKVDASRVKRKSYFVRRLATIFNPVILSAKQPNDLMKFTPQQFQAKFAKVMAAACVRRGYLEKLHCGTPPATRTGDYSDVKVIDAAGREIPWTEVSRISQDEMKTLMTGVVNRIHTFLSRTLFSATEDKEFEQALERAVAPWIKAWDEPKFLADFLMPHSEKQE